MRGAAGTRSDRVAWPVVAGLVVVVALGAVLLVGVLVNEDGGPPVTVVVGDSVTALSSERIDEAWSGQVEVVARSGLRSDQLLEMLVEAVERRGGPDSLAGHRVALLVGYNDVIQGREENPSLVEMVERTSRFGCAVWFSLPELPHDAERYRRWNERLAAEVERYPDVHLETSWQRDVEARGDVLLSDDGLHPGVRGTERLAELYRAAVDRRC